MARSLIILGIVCLGLAGCTAPPAALGPDGKPIPRAYQLSSSDTDEIQLRMLDAINALRRANDVPPLELDSALNAAAATHSRDMSVQNRPWHFGSDGSSPLDRVRRAGYDGTLGGEDISETYETEIQTLADWMQNPGTREVILSPDARDMGFAFFQEDNGKLWWTLVTGEPAPAAERGAAIEEPAGAAF